MERGAYDPERVQLCVQGMILEEHGYRCDEGVLYFVESRERVTVRFDDELRTLTGEENLEDAFVRVIGSEEGLYA